MKTKEQQLNYDYYQTFKYTRGESDGNWLIYSGRLEDKRWLITPQIAFFNFKTEDDAKKFCDRLNKIADKAKHQNKM